MVFVPRLLYSRPLPPERKRWSVVKSSGGEMRVWLIAGRKGIMEDLDLKAEPSSELGSRFDFYAVKVVVWIKSRESIPEGGLQGAPSKFDAYIGSENGFAPLIGHRCY